MRKPRLGWRILTATGCVCIGIAEAAASSEMEHPALSLEYGLWALFLGGLSAISLLMGSAMGLVWKPRPPVTAVFIAFGGGALLAALSVELVAPTAMAVIGHGAGGYKGETHGGNPQNALIALLIGCVAGGFLFAFLDAMLSSKGGYLRKVSTTITYLAHRRRENLEDFIERLSHLELFRTLTPEHVRELTHYIRTAHFNPGEEIFREGDDGDRFFFIARGRVSVQRADGDPVSFGKDDLLGERTMIADHPRTATAIAQTHVEALEILHEDFDQFCEEAPEIMTARKRLADSQPDDTLKTPVLESQEADEWAEEATEHLVNGHHAALNHQAVKHAVAEHGGGAPLAIWLGIFLDGIPESFIIGATFLAILLGKSQNGGTPVLAEVIPYTLIAGLFLSNFPEAMSSSVGMRNQGWSPLRILLLWGSLVAMTGIGAVIGYILGAEVSHTTVVAVEGVAAGAMLTMIAQTMIPEAVHLGRANLVGLTTLAGFLSAVAFKLIEK